MAKIKILKASYYYPECLKQVYTNNSVLFEKSYSEQYDYIMSKRLLWSDSWKFYLEKTGKFDVFEIISNNELMQKKWLSENCIKKQNLSINWQSQIICLQIEAYRPDILFLHDNVNFNASIVQKIRKDYPFIKLIIGYDGIALNNYNKFDGFDIVLSCLKESANFYSMQKDLKGIYFPHCFDTRIPNEIDSQSKNIEFSFIGSLFKGSGYHNQRINNITKLVNNTPLEVFSSSFDEPFEPYRYLQRKRLLKFQINDFWQVYSIGKKKKNSVFGIDMFEILASSKLTFNSHIDVAGKTAANMRLFEATGVGCCLITDFKDNLNDFFDPDFEIVTYKTISECIDKVKNLLRDNGLRNKIARAGQERVLNNHNFESRLNTIYPALLEKL